MLIGENRGKTGLFQLRHDVFASEMGKRVIDEGG